MSEERIAKIISRAGYCSRREAERLIDEGRVNLNGKVVETPATKCQSSDQITIDNKLIPPIEQTKLYLYNKRRGELVTNKDPEGRRTIYDSLPANMQQLKAVGRLDYNTEGLLLLTNDGELARFLELPQNRIKRTYKVRVYATPSAEMLSTIKKGITIKGIKYNVLNISMEKQDKTNCWLRIELEEGKNREIRNILQYFNLPISRLIRIAYGEYKIGELKPGEYKPVNKESLVSF